jgi:LTXXQ motif family protein
MAFAEKMAEAKLAGLKAVEPKLQAFYDSLDEKQKKAFDTGGRMGALVLTRHFKKYSSKFQRLNELL